MTVDSLLTLMHRLGCVFDDRSLLETAVTHRSYANESHKDVIPDNERLEFLGDAVIDLVVSEELVSAQPEWNEGQLSVARAAMVSEKALARQARKLELGESLRLGRGESRTGGRDKDSLLSDAFEAILGAILLDQGIDACRETIHRLFKGEFSRAKAAKSVEVDPKTEVQERLMSRYQQTPHYGVLAQSGPAHGCTFTIALYLGDRMLAVGSGSNKKIAAQRAAQATLLAMDRLPGARHD